MLWIKIAVRGKFCEIVSPCMAGVGCIVADETSVYSSNTTVEAELPEAFLVSVCQLLWIHDRRAVWVRGEDPYGTIVTVNKPLCSRAWWRVWKEVSRRGCREAYVVYRAIHKRFSENGAEDPLWFLSTSRSIGKRMRNVKRWRWLTFLCTRTLHLVKSSIAWPEEEEWDLELTPVQRLKRLGALVRHENHSVCWLLAGGAPAACMCSCCKALCLNEWDAAMDAMLESQYAGGSDVVGAFHALEGGGVASGTIARSMAEDHVAVD